MKRVFAVAVVAVLCSLASPAGAPPLPIVYDVNSLADLPDFDLGDGLCDADAAAPGNQCTLRAAIQNANLTTDPVTINLPAGTYKLKVKGNGEDLGATGDLDITGDVTLIGAGSAKTIIDAKKTKDRVFDVKTGATASISDVTIAHGKTTTVAGTDTFGGGIDSHGTLTLTRCNVTHCHATEFGGGLDCFHVATLTDCSIVSNSAGKDQDEFAGWGGGINLAGATTTITGCTIANNTSTTNSGGIRYDGGGSLIVVNSTISGNHAQTKGGGITSGDASTTTLRHVTIASNTAKDSAGISVTGLGVMTIANCLLYKNQNNCDGIILSLGGNVELGDKCGFGAGDKSNADSKLAALKDNGGPTRTRKLKKGSAAIGAGKPENCEPLDQRGQPRKPNCDAGAYETP